MTLLRHPSIPCTIRYQTPGPPDEHNDPTSVWTEVETTCVLQQKARSEIGEGQLSAELWFVWLPVSEPFPHGTDQLVVDGVTYEFTADPWLARNLHGQADHIHGSLSRAA
jgi:hypothetical protein